MQTPYKFYISSGMDGFMPNYTSGPLLASTRKELMDILRDELEMLDFPANRINDFNVKSMWSFIQNAKSGSSCHSSCDNHNGECLRVHGLTDDEYQEMLDAEDY